MNAPHESVADHSLIGPYLVDALTDAERAEFDRHLADCARCQAEVFDLREGLAEFTAVLSAPPPAALRSSVLSAIAEVAQEPATPDVSEPAPQTEASADQSAGWAWQIDEPPVDELAVRRNRRLTRGLILAVAAVAVVALALGGAVYNLNQDRQREIANEQITAQQAQVERQRETDLLAAPDAKVYAYSVNGGRASFVVSKSRDEALFIGTNLPSPGADRVYQLWTVQAEPAVDNAVTGSGTVRQWFRGPVGDSTALAVNVEPASGPPAANKPSGDILALASLA